MMTDKQEKLQDNEQELEFTELVTFEDLDDFELARHAYKQAFSKLESKSVSELNNIFAQLHKADDRIIKDREDTVRLNNETKVMLADLRKKIG
jgi:hypothetical protein